MYFSDCKNLNEAKNLFRKLCVKLHPDTSGADTQAEFIKMYNEFQQLKFDKDGNKASVNSSNFSANSFYNLVKKFDGLAGVSINFIGSFIWLTDEAHGAMYKQKERIKEIKIEGYRPAKWANIKKSWFFSPEWYKGNHGHFLSLDEAAQRYGRQVFKASTQFAIPC